eukprot:SAG31_NODE_129_length_23447_cov_5.010922_9_plen_188_part_00
MGLDRWAREVELREKEVELMQKLQLSFSEQVQIDLEALRCISLTRNLNNVTACAPKSIAGCRLESVRADHGRELCVRSEMRAHGISTENRLKHLPLSLSRRPAEEPQSPATTGLIDQTTANSTTSAVRRQSTGAAANRTGSKAATLAAASSYFARKGEATVDPVAAPAPRSNRAADRADLLFSTLDR